MGELSCTTKESMESQYQTKGLQCVGGTGPCLKRAHEMRALCLYEKLFIPSRVSACDLQARVHQATGNPKGEELGPSSSSAPPSLHASENSK